MDKKPRADYALCGCGRWKWKLATQCAECRLRPVEDRLWEKVVKTEGGCWLWQAVTTKFGYGKIKVGNRQMSTHRVAYELLVGPIPEGLVIDHLCRVPACVNPSHMEVVTMRENALRGISSPTAANAKKTRCGRNHPFTPENTYINPAGSRVCRTCVRQRNRRYALRKKVAR